MKDKKRISKQKGVELAMQLLEKGYATEQIMAEIGGKWRIAPSTIEKHIAEARAKLSEKRQLIEKELLALEIEAEKKAREKAIMSIQDRKEFLTKIATAETNLQKIGGQTVSIIVWDDGRKEIVTLADKHKAIQELNKMDGGYAPKKIEHSGESVESFLDQFKNVNVE